MFEENGFSSSRRSHKHGKGRKKRSSAREALSRSLQELEGVGEEDFYDRLVQLRNEHKKTLKNVEKLYYGELEKQRAGFQLDSQTRITVDDEPRMAYKTYDPGNYNPFEEDAGLDEKDTIVASRSPVDHVKDMSTTDEPARRGSRGTSFVCLYFTSTSLHSHVFTAETQRIWDYNNQKRCLMYKLWWPNCFLFVGGDTCIISKRKVCIFFLLALKIRKPHSRLLVA